MERTGLGRVPEPPPAGPLPERTGLVRVRDRTAILSERSVSVPVSVNQELTRTTGDYTGSPAPDQTAMTCLPEWV